MLGVMYISPDIAKQPLSPAAKIILGTIFLAVAGFLFYLVFDGIKAGEIWKISKFESEFITKLDRPQQFWSVIIMYSVTGLLSTTISTCFLVSGIRKLCR
jgi:hypothetical protein